jgi:hypothetical protein
MKLLKRRKYNVTCWDLSDVKRINIIKRVDPVTSKVTGEKAIELVTPMGSEVIVGDWTDDQLEELIVAFCGNLKNIIEI